MKTFCPGFLALLVLLTGCPQPQSVVGPREGRELVLQLQSPSRTLGPDWSTLIQTYQATLKSQNGYADVTGSVSGSSTLVLTGIRTGTWDLEVLGLDGTAQVVARAQLSNQAIPAAGTITVSMVPTQMTTGSYSLSLRFPWFADASQRITRITGQLTKADLTPVGAAFDQVPVDLGSGTAEAVFSATGVASGPYRLALTLFRGTDAAKYVIEAINVYDNVNSNRWIDSVGTAQTARVLGSGEFSPTNTDLAGLSLEVDGAAMVLTPAFDPATKGGYTVSVASPTLTQALVPTAIASLPGTAQHLEWSTDGGLTWIPMVTGIPQPAFDLVQGSNLVQFRVFVNRNGVTASSVYEVTLTKTVLASGISLTPPTLTLATNAPATMLTAQVLPAEADQSVTFSSSDPTLATVDAAGLVQPLLPGTVTITATSTDGGFVASTTLTLTPSQYFLKATGGAFWSDLGSSPTPAPWATIALAGTPSRLLALDDTGDLWEYKGLFWSKLNYSAPSSARWISLGKAGVVLAATPSQVYLLENGFWSSGIPPSPVTIQALAAGPDGIHIAGSDGALWSFKGGIWVKEQVLPPAPLTGLLMTSQSSLLVQSGTQFYEWNAGLWTPMALAAVPQTATSTFAFDRLVSLIVR